MLFKVFNASSKSDSLSVVIVVIVSESARDNKFILQSTESKIKHNKNIYENFLEFQPSTQKELYEFSTSSFRDFTYIPQTFKKKSETTIYIPTFSIDAHLFSYDFKEVKKNVKMTDKESNTDAHLNSVDEFVHIEFKPDKNIDNSFSVIPVIGGTNDILINDSFIIGIFDNDIINNNILPLLQILYITKDHFLTKNNFFP